MTDSAGNCARHGPRGATHSRIEIRTTYQRCCLRVTSAWALVRRESIIMIVVVGGLLPCRSPGTGTARTDTPMHPDRLFRPAVGRKECFGRWARPFVVSDRMQVGPPAAEKIVSARNRLKRMFRPVVRRQCIIFKNDSFYVLYFELSLKKY